MNGVRFGSELPVAEPARAWQPHAPEPNACAFGYVQGLRTGERVSKNRLRRIDPALRSLTLAATNENL